MNRQSLMSLCCVPSICLLGEVRVCLHVLAATKADVHVKIALGISALAAFPHASATIRLLQCIATA